MVDGADEVIPLSIRVEVVDEPAWSGDVEASSWDEAHAATSANKTIVNHRIRSQVMPGDSFIL